MSLYRILATLHVVHAYHGGPCRDLDVIVPAETAAVLRRGRMFVKAQAGALHVVYEAGEGGGPRVTLSDETLRFGLRPTSPYFSNVTDPASLPARGNVALSRNHAALTSLDAPVPHVLVGNVFAHVLAEAARPVTVTAADARGRALRAEEVTPLQGRAAVAFDLTGVEPGAVTVTESYPAGVTRSARYLVHPELSREPLLGVVEIAVRPELYAGAPPTFEVAFAARQETLRYYLVVTGHTEAELGSLAVADAGFTDDGRARIDFAQVSPPFAPGELSTAMLGATDPAARFVMFRSLSPVARQERARRKIQLRRNGDVLVEHLPQPRAEQSDANLIIHVSKAR